MRINKKDKKDNNYNQDEQRSENEKKTWPEDRPIKTFRPTETTKEEKRYNIDTGLS